MNGGHDGHLFGQEGSNKFGLLSIMIGKMKQIFWVLTLVFCSCTEQPTHPRELSICAIFKNEAQWFKEWIIYHRDVVGVEHFYLYNNESTDDYQSVLAPFIKEGIVEVFDWDSKSREHLAFGAFMDSPWNAAQLGAYNDCLKNKALGISKWVAMIDVDEFIVPANGKKKFYQLLKKAEKDNKGTVSIHWRMFGTSGVDALKDGELLIEKMLRRSKDDHSTNKAVKSIHRPEAVDFCLIHIAEKLKPGFGAKTLKPHLVQLNHYWTRTSKFCEKKRHFTKQNRPELFEALDQTQDTLILQYVPQIKDKI